MWLLAFEPDLLRLRRSRGRALKIIWGTFSDAMTHCWIFEVKGTRPATELVQVCKVRSSSRRKCILVHSDLLLRCWWSTRSDLHQYNLRPDHTRRRCAPNPSIFFHQYLFTHASAGKAQNTFLFFLTVATPGGILPCESGPRHFFLYDPLSTARDKREKLS